MAVSNGCTSDGCTREPDGHSCCLLASWGALPQRLKMARAGQEQIKKRHSRGKLQVSPSAAAPTWAGLQVLAALSQPSVSNHSGSQEKRTTSAPTWAGLQVSRALPTPLSNTASRLNSVRTKVTLQHPPGLASRSWWPRRGAHSGSLGRLHSLCSCSGNRESRAREVGQWHQQQLTVLHAKMPRL